MGFAAALMSLGLFLTILVWGGIIVLISLIVFWPLGLFLGFFWLILLFVSVVSMIASPFAK
jgi:hypothetical protein